MTAKAFLVPTVLGTDGWEPSVLGVARSLPGFTRAGALIADTPDRLARLPWCVLTVFADDFSDLEAMADVHGFGGVAQGKLSQYLASLDARPMTLISAAKRLALARRLRDCGFDVALDADSCGAALRRVMRFFEPAATDDLYERKFPEVKQTITDSFTGADNDPLGSGWAAAEGTAWKITSNAAVQVSNYALSAMVRTETSFPDDQYSECVTGVWTGDSYSTGSPIVRCTSNTYYHTAATGFGTAYRTLYRRNSGTNTYITDFTLTQAIGSTYTLKLAVTGTTLEFFQNGVSKGTVVNSSISSGKPGIAGAKSGGVNAPCDDFACTDSVVASSAPPPGRNQRSRIAPLMHF